MACISSHEVMYFPVLHKNSHECLQVLQDSARTCGSTRWKAAKATSKTMAIDETGLEVAECRHVIGQKAINMFRGEMLVSICTCYKLYQIVLLLSL